MEVLVGLLLGDPQSFLNQDPLWTPVDDMLGASVENDRFGSGLTHQGSRSRLKPPEALPTNHHAPVGRSRVIAANPASTAAESVPPEVS